VVGNWGEGKSPFEKAVTPKTTMKRERSRVRRKRENKEDKNAKGERKTGGEDAKGFLNNAQQLQNNQRRKKKSD